MRDHYDIDAPLAREPRHRAHQPLAHLGVQRRGRLVQQQYRGLGDQRARERHALPLATREPPRVAVQVRARQLGRIKCGAKSTGEVVQASHRVERCGGAQIVADRAGKHRRRLEHEAHASPERPDRVARERLIVVQDLARARVVESVE